MAVNQRIMQREDFAAILRELKDIDAKSIAAAAEEHRKQMALTDEEITKLAESRSYIAKYEEMRAELEKKEGTLKTERESHERDKSEFEKKVIAVQEDISKKGSDLRNIEKEQTSRLDAIKKANEDLDARVKSVEDYKSHMEKQYADKMKDLSDIELAQQKESKRLGAWELRLKEKAKKIAAVVEVDE